jgi:hypothetical protein
MMAEYWAYDDLKGRIILNHGHGMMSPTVQTFTYLTEPGRDQAWEDVTTLVRTMKGWPVTLKGSNLGDLKMALQMIETRQVIFEKQRDEALAAKKYGSAYGFEQTAVGLMMAAKIIREEMNVAR